MKFSDVIGHEEQKTILRDMVDSDRMPHALLISGRSGLGKMQLARALATYIHCTNRRNGDSCGLCPDCRRHASFNHPDLHFSFPIVKSAKEKIEKSDDMFSQFKEMLARYPYMQWEKWLEIIKAGNSQPLIHVEESNEIISRAALSSYTSPHKIFIIWLPEKLKEEAANKLLKVIEEPFADTRFILVSNDEKGLLPTIYSRTRRLPLHRILDNEIERYIQKISSLPEEKCADLARLAEGSPGKAMALALHNDENVEFRLIFQEMMRMAYKRNFSILKQIADRSHAMGREKLMRLLIYMADMVRENFIYNLHEPRLNLLSAEEEEFSRRFSPFINHANVERMILEIDRTRREVSRNANGKIAMFDLFLIICALLRLK